MKMFKRGPYIYLFHSLRLYQYENVHKGRRIFLPTYLSMSDVLWLLLRCTTYYVRFSLRYLPTQKSEFLYGRSLLWIPYISFKFPLPTWRQTNQWHYFSLIKRRDSILTGCLMYEFLPYCVLNMSSNRSP